MRVGVAARRPAAEQLALLIQGKRLAGEPAGLTGGQVPGRVGSARMTLRLRAKRKNCRSTVSRRFRARGRTARNASMSWTSASAQSCLPRAASRNRARSRMVARAASMVRSLLGLVPARRARSREASIGRRTRPRPGAAAIKCLYLVTRSLDPTGTGRTRWTMRWKPALNAFAITFADRFPAPEIY